MVQMDLECGLSLENEEYYDFYYQVIYTSHHLACSHVLIIFLT